MQGPVTGWRFWIVSPDDDDAALLGPCRGETWAARDSRDFEAHCQNPEHAPPVANCGCGVYGWPNLVDTRLWMRRTHQWGFPPSYIHRFGWPPTQPPRPFFVLGRVTLFDAIDMQPHPRTLYDTDAAIRLGVDRGRIVYGPRALAASRAVVEALWIFPTNPLRPWVDALQATLAARWDGVAVKIGEPDYTAQEWDGKQSASELCEEFGLFAPVLAVAVG